MTRAVHALLVAGAEGFSRRLEADLPARRTIGHEVGGGPWPARS